MWAQGLKRGCRFRFRDRCLELSDYWGAFELDNINQPRVYRSRKIWNPGVCVFFFFFVYSGSAFNQEEFGLKHCGVGIDWNFCALHGK